jgi:hypothetical protein
VLSNVARALSPRLRPPPKFQRVGSPVTEEELAFARKTLIEEGKSDPKTSVIRQKVTKLC